MPILQYVSSHGRHGCLRGPTFSATPLPALAVHKEAQQACRPPDCCCQLSKLHHWTSQPLTYRSRSAGRRLKYHLIPGPSECTRSPYSRVRTATSEISPRTPHRQQDAR
ncbi:hypothetical protein MTO96_035193 [Rhipicephalus appendiculatus]